MKNNRIFSGVLLIAAALLLLLVGFGANLALPFSLTPGQLVGAVLCVVLAVHLVTHHSVHLIYIPIAILYVLFEGYIADSLGLTAPLINRWILVAIVFLLCVGTDRLFGKNYRYKKYSDSEPITDDRDDTPHNYSENSLAAKIRYVDAAALGDVYFENNLGKLEVFIQNEENYPGGLTMKLGNNLGSLTVHVPAAWNVIDKNSANQLGEVYIRPNTDPNGKTLFIRAENNLGRTEIVSP